MIDRIEKNEERLDSLALSVKNLSVALEEFKSNKKNISILQKYYGSSAWFKDKDDYEKGKLGKIKAGVLSEDAVWNLFEEIDSILSEFKDISNDYYKDV